MKERKRPNGHRKRISCDLEAQRRPGSGNGTGTRKDLDYIVLTTFGLKRSDVWLTPGEARRLAEYLEAEKPK